MAFVYLNGEYLPEAEAKIPVKDRGLRFGDGVFETITAYSGIPYQWELHLKRLKESLRTVSISFSPDTLHAHVLALIQKNALPDCLLRITITRGSSDRGYLPPADVKPTVIIETFPMPQPLAAPVSLWLSSYRKIPAACLPIHTKTLQGLNSVLARMEASANGCFEALLLGEKGHICECSSANIFWAKGDTLFTPSLECGILPGTTRDAVIRLSPYKVAQGFFTLEQLQEADEIFLTNVSMRTIPVQKLSWVDTEWKTHDRAAELNTLMKRDIEKYVAARNAAVV